MSRSAKIALIVALAIPVTVILGPFALTATVLGIGSFFDHPSPGQAVPILLGFFGLVGICGLWLRVFIAPSAQQSPSISNLVTVMLLAGAASALALAGITAIAIATSNGDGIAGVLSLAIFFLGLGLIWLAMAANNFRANRALRRKAAEPAASGPGEPPATGV